MNHIIIKGKSCFSQQITKLTRLEEAQNMIEKYDFMGVKRLMLEGSGKGQKTLKMILKLK